MAFTIKTDIEILQEIGRRLRAYRLQQNLTQAEVALHAGVNRTTIRDIEAGKDTQLSTLAKLLRALDRLEDLDVFLPKPSLSPIQLMKTQNKPRQRARKSADG